MKSIALFLLRFFFLFLPAIYFIGVLISGDRLSADNSPGLVILGAIGCVYYGVKIFTAISTKSECPECKEKNTIVFDGSKIIDRYDTSKEVYERTATGKRKTRYMKCTKVVRQKHYHCSACGYKYKTTVNEELT